MIPKVIAGTPQVPLLELDPNAEKDHALNYSASMGWVYHTYNSNAVSMAQYSVLTKGSVSYSSPFLPGYTFEWGSFFTALPLNTSRVLVNGNLNDVTIRFLGTNLRAGYETPMLKGYWKLGLNLGWYFNTTFVTQNLFGYESVTGPQFFPMVTYQMGDLSTLRAYFKWSPIVRNISFMRTSENYEIASGVSWTFPFDFLGLNQYLLQFDFAHLSLKPNEVRVISNSSSFSLGALFH